ncbi:unnamed protein product [Boreogadus saida]
MKSDSSQFSDYEVALCSPYVFLGQSGRLAGRLPTSPFSIGSSDLVPRARFEENLDVQGELIVQDSFQVWDPKSLIRKGRDRRLFLFEMCLIFSKEIRDSAGRTKYQFKQKLQTSELGVTEHIEGDPLKLALWAGRTPSSDNKIVLKANSVEVKQEWIKSVREVIQDRMTHLKGALKEPLHLPKAPTLSKPRRRSVHTINTLLWGRVYVVVVGFVYVVVVGFVYVVVVVVGCVYVVVGGRVYVVVVGFVYVVVVVVVGCVYVVVGGCAYVVFGGLCLCGGGGLCLCWWEMLEDGDSQGKGSSQPDSVSIASQNTVDSDKRQGQTLRDPQLLWRSVAS